MSGLYTEQRLSGNGVYAGTADIGGTSIACSLGTATASGFQASIAVSTVIACALGTADATGFQAVVSTDGSTTINCALSTATASGFRATVSSGGGTGATAAEIWAYEIAPGLSAAQALLDLWQGRHTTGEVADAVVAKTLGARTLGAHIQAIAATQVGETTGAGTSHMTYTDGAVTVEADVPLPGVAGDRENVVITGV